MKRNTSVILSFGLLVLACSLYRVWDGRPWGFAPQIAIALFSGAIIREKKYAFLMPLASMLLSDSLYQLLYVNGLSKTPGFYGGQATNYVLFMAMTVFGFFIKNFNVGRILGASLAAPTAYFLLSNFLVWTGGGGYGHPKNFGGLMQTLADGLPFYGGSLAATVLFSGLFFSAWYAINQKQRELAF
ncbi:hypothetical protein EPD60_15960 [Flaviaesturariibacter flavus]|uniref:Uncharacterized protein n=1 Tax=Flaviaesturariibacter flavus TaxID=2502780 RepID=A0A4R1B3I8_9BACT|nr:DUF6580 family putative transport protein [Flaviaesturariibacter flavus]TCJ12050.1 hypothetical protein EPD60_15960 [Flaviaesturariibacter flavus]